MCALVIWLHSHQMVSLLNHVHLQPLQAACEVHADHDVINFLAFMHPRAVAERDYKGDLIIHSVLGQGVHDIPKRTTIELLLSLNPESLHERSADGACPLGVAFRAKQGPKILEKIICIRIQQQITSFEIGEWKDYILDAKDVSRLSFELFPKLFLTSLTCAPLAYSEAGFIYLMEYLMQDNRIEELTLSVPPLNEPKAIAFLRFLRLNSTIRQLQLTRNHSQWTLGNGIECILDGLHLNNSIQHLTMAGVFLFSSDQLGCLISRAPETLVLDDLLVENKWNWENSKEWGTSKVKSLTIRNVKMGGKCLDKLLGAMPTLYALRDLTLDFSVPQDLHDAEFLNGRDVTPQIVALLEKNRIRSLDIKGLHVEIMSLTQALRNNTSLRVLHMDALWNELPMKVQCLVHILENENRSLEDIKFHCESELLGDDQQSELDEVEDTSIGNICQLVEDPALTFYTERNRCQRRQKLLNVPIR